jgi:hypothetical protein
MGSFHGSVMVEPVFPPTMTCVFECLTYISFNHLSIHMKCEGVVTRSVTRGEGKRVGKGGNMVSVSEGLATEVEIMVGGVCVFEVGVDVCNGDGDGGSAYTILEAPNGLTVVHFIDTTG